MERDLLPRFALLVRERVTSHCSSVVGVPKCVQT